MEITEMSNDFNRVLSRVLYEWTEMNDEALRLVGKFSVSKMYDLNMCDWHIPFIYVSDIPEIQFKAKLFFGSPKHTHSEMITDAIGKDIFGRELDNLDFDPPDADDSTVDDEDPSAYLYDEYYEAPAAKYSGPPTLDRLLMAAYGDGLIGNKGKEILFDAAIGRIGIDISNDFLNKHLSEPFDLYDLLRSATVVSYSAQENTPASVVDACNKLICSTSLPGGQQVGTDAFYVMNGKAFNIDVAAIASTKEDIRKGELQKALHIGAWPDGTRLTQREKYYIRTELGVKKDNSPPLPTFGSERRRLATKRDLEYPELSKWTASEGYDNWLSDYELINESLEGGSGGKPKSCAWGQNNLFYFNVEGDNCGSDWCYSVYFEELLSNEYEVEFRRGSNNSKDENRGGGVEVLGAVCYAIKEFIKIMNPDSLKWSPAKTKTPNRVTGKIRNPEGRRDVYDMYFVKNIFPAYISVKMNEWMRRDIYDRDYVKWGYPSIPDELTIGSSGVDKKQFMQEIRAEGEKRKVTWVSPNIDEEMPEFELTSETLNIDLNILIDAAQDAKLVPLDEFSMWRYLLNTESYKIKKGDMDAVYSIASKYGRDVESIINAFVQGGTLPAPIVLVRKNLKPYLIGGNTRLMVARAMGVQPLILKVQL